MPGLAWGLAVIIGLLLLAVLTPWHVRLAGRTAPLGARVEVRLLAGYAPAIRFPVGPRAKKAQQAKPSKPRKARKRRRRRSVPRGVGDLVLGLLAAFRIRRLHLSGRIGLDDPADTGALWGQLTPLVYGLGGPSREIALAPAFDGPCLDLEGFAEVAIRPVRLLRAGLGFALANRRAA
jgi:hypothetical protein